MSEFFSEVTTFTDTSYSISIQKQAGTITEIVDWCFTNVNRDWRWTVVEPSSRNHFGEYYFIFESEKDFLNFSLVWA
jgi:hypothetical protein